MQLLDAIAYAMIICGGLAIPLIALRHCPQCGSLTRRTRRATHRR